MDQSDEGRKLMENFLNPLLDVEADLRMGGGRFVKVTERQYTRNGYRRCKPKTQLGTLNLEIPTFRDGNFKTALFEPGARKSDGILLPTMKLLAYASLPDTVRTYGEELCQLPLPNGPLTKLVYHYAHVIRDFKKRPLELAYLYVLRLSLSFIPSIGMRFWRNMRKRHQERWSIWMRIRQSSSPPIFCLTLSAKKWLLGKRLTLLVP